MSKLLKCSFYDDTGFCFAKRSCWCVNLKQDYWLRFKLYKRSAPEQSINWKRCKLQIKHFSRYNRPYFRGPCKICLSVFVAKSKKVIFLPLAASSKVEGAVPRQVRWEALDGTLGRRWDKYNTNLYVCLCLCMCMCEHVYTCKCAHMLVWVHKNVSPEVSLCHKFTRWGPMTKNSPERKTQSLLNTDSLMKSLCSIQSSIIYTDCMLLYSFNKALIKLLYW